MFLWLSVILAAALVAGLVTAGVYSASPSPSGDIRACQMVKTELSGAGHFGPAEAAAVNPQLRQDISMLAYALPMEGRPGQLGSAYAVLAGADVAGISSECEADRVTGIGQ